MKGISYIVDEEGRRRGLRIDCPDLSKDELEDLEDSIVTLLRRHEPTVPWEVLAARIPSILGCN